MSQAAEGTTPKPPQAPERDYHPACRVCRHVNRTRIELAVAKGGSYRAVATAFDVPYFSVFRHWKNHVPEKIKAARQISVLAPGRTLEDIVNEEGTDLFQTLTAVRRALLWRLDQSTQLDDNLGVAQLSAQLHKNIGLAAQFRGELIHRTQHVSVSLVMHEDYLELRAKLVRALQKFPDALGAVLEAFHSLEGRPAITAEVSS